MTNYDTIISYLNANSDFTAKIARYNAMIEALELQMLANIEGQEFDSYELDDGQSRIKTVIKDYSKIESMITGIERLKQRLINQNIGRITKNKPAITF